MKKALECATLVAIALLMSSTARAAPLDGSFSFVGTEDVRVGATYIDWGRFNDIFGPPDGEIRFTTGNGSFAGIAGTLGTILDLNAATAPVETNLNIANFITSAANPTWNFTLNWIFQGSGSVGCVGVVAPGATCTPFIGSPFTITNLGGGGSAVGLNMRGTVTDAVGPASTWQGVFTTQFTQFNASELVALVQTQGFVQSSHSAQVDATTAAVPEPASLLLLAGGLVTLATRLRRRR